MELRNLNVRGTGLDFSLENRDLAILFSKQLLLVYYLFILFVVLSLDLLQDGCLLCCLHLLLALDDALLFLL